MKWLMVVCAAVVLGVGLVGCSNSSSGGSSTAPAGKKYTCSMDGGTRDSAGPCPKCGMQLK
ncbi:MAG: heavy metal-binding domain-containing protein [Anaerolineales bacterium]